MAELSNIRTGENGVQVETENRKFTIMCSRFPQNLKFGNFLRRCCLAEHGAGPLFFSLNSVVLSRCRCLRRSSFLNSVVSKKIEHDTVRFLKPNVKLKEIAFFFLLWYCLSKRILS